MKTTHCALQIWGVPVLMSLSSACGLGAALLDDGFGDILSWIALAAPIFISLRYAVSGKRR